MTPVKPRDEQIHFKTWLNWGRRFEIFPIEKNNKESQYQKSFSAFFTSVSHTKSHWYSLKVLNDVIPSLSNLMGISQENLKKLFTLSSFSKSNKSRNFINQKLFESFQNEFGIQEHCEFIQAKHTGFSSRQWFI
jgi:hypothetical protein